MKKTLCILLVLLMTLSTVLVACNEAEQGGGASEDVSEAPKGYVPHLGETDKYKGQTLKILAGAGNTKEEFPAFNKEAIDATELTSEPVNDAAYNRNQSLKTNYGFDIQVEWVQAFDGMLERVRSDKASGLGEYDVIIGGLSTMGTLAAEGFFMDLYSIEDSNLQLDKPWWDGAANEDMSIANKLYFSTGDIVMMDDENTRCVVYSRKIHKDNNLEDIAQLVKDGKWTLDKFHEMAQAAAVDNGESGMTYNQDDVWGSVMAAFDTYTLVVGCDSPMVVKDDDDIPVLSVMKEANYNAFLKVYDTIITDEAHCAYTERFVNWSDTSVIDNFANGKALFFVTTVGTINGAKFRESEVDYGILPVPKRDVDQERYTSATNPYWFHVVSIDENCKNTDFVTFALEAMAWSAKEYITPEYYERTLKNKRALNDEYSPEMLDILFSNRLVDISIVFNWDNCIQYYNNCLKTGGNGLASLIESRQDAFNAAMEETIDLFTN